LDGVLQTSATLPGTGSAAIANRLLLSAGSTVAGEGSLRGEVSDFRVYASQRSATQIGNDMSFGSRASSLFAFQGIVPSLLEEELALLP